MSNAIQQANAIAHSGRRFLTHSAHPGHTSRADAIQSAHALTTHTDTMHTMDRLQVQSQTHPMHIRHPPYAHRGWQRAVWIARARPFAHPLAHHGFMMCPPTAQPGHSTRPWHTYSRLALSGVQHTWDTAHIRHARPMRTLASSGCSWMVANMPLARPVHTLGTHLAHPAHRMHTSGTPCAYHGYTADALWATISNHGRRLLTAGLGGYRTVGLLPTRRGNAMKVLPRANTDRRLLAVGPG